MLGKELGKLHSAYLLSLNECNHLYRAIRAGPMHNIVTSPAKNLRAFTMLFEEVSAKTIVSLLTGVRDLEQCEPLLIGISVAA